MKPLPVPTEILSLDLEQRPWAAFASCRTADPETFFPTTEQAAMEAIRICRGCPVRVECLEWALDTRARYGIWGGLTERQRRRVARQPA